MSEYPVNNYTISYKGIQNVKAVEKQVGWDVVRTTDGKTIVVKVKVPRGYKRGRVIL